MAARPGRSCSKRLIISDAKCWASAADPPLPQARILPPWARLCTIRRAALSIAGESASAASSLVCAEALKWPRILSCKGMLVAIIPYRRKRSGSIPGRCRPTVRPRRNDTAAAFSAWPDIDARWPAASSDWPGRDFNIRDNAGMSESPHHTPLFPALYVVATPIGNLGDITLRALDILQRVDRVAAEDTRVSGQLLAHFNISKPLMAIREHNEREAAAGVVARIAAGEAVAYVSDAGTPAVSDPGARLVAAVRAAGF